MVTSEDVVVVDCPLAVVVVEAADDDDDEEAEIVVDSATFDVGSGVGSAFGSPDDEEWDASVLVAGIVGVVSADESAALMEKYYFILILNLKKYFSVLILTN